MSYCENSEQATLTTAKNIGLLRNTYIPVTVPGDSEDPRVNKIGGKIPIIEHYKTWKEADFQMCWQLYIPSLPVEVRRILPYTIQNGMLAIRMDTGASYEMLFFEEETLDAVTYIEDIVPSSKYAWQLPHQFNSPHLITGWEHDQQVPDMQNLSYTVFRNDSLNCIFSDRRYHRKHNGFSTRLCGFANYQQYDEMPGVFSDGWNMFMEMNEDSSFTLMFGDCGQAHFFVNKERTAFECHYQWS